MKLITKIIIATIVANMPILVIADDIGQQYWETKDGTKIKAGFGDCWQTRDYVRSPGLDSCGEPIVAVVVPEPAPAPVQIVAAAPEVIPVTQIVRFSDEALFAFDKSELKPEGKTMLDSLVKQLDNNLNTTYEDIMITGHTDRIGSSEYNQSLSDRRARTVRDYLTNSNLQSYRINAVGKGEMEPVTYAEECKGTSNNVIACLQPDRRVEVTITGAQTISSTN